MGIALLCHLLGSVSIWTISLRLGGMDLYLVPTDPGNLHLVSTNGTIHYQITTIAAELIDTHCQGPRITLIQRPVAFSESTEESVVAEIDWKHGDHPAVIRGPLTWYSKAQCIGSQGIGIKATKFLYQRNKLGPYLGSSARYFLGDDGSEYRWKMLRGGERKLIRTEDGMEEATFFEITSAEGAFAGEKKEVLRVQACSIDVDLIVLTFILMEIERWERMGLFGPEVEHEGEPAGDGGADEGNAEGGFGEMVGEM